MTSNYQEILIALNPDRTPCYGYVKNRTGCYSTVGLTIEYCYPWQDYYSGIIESNRVESLSTVKVEECQYCSGNCYNFWMEINNKCEGDIGVEIGYMCSSCYSCMNKKNPHHIILSGKAKADFLDELDYQLVGLYGKNSRQLLEEARKQRWPKEDMV